ncbi:MAG: tRNA threonylcarbamoyladenosine dehydratase [Lactobacillales bacterium]|jgi:tRNA A37 threonylcarbamoyladenosine dehydratase|nr:tRNA threonylcarbamoyladenosine dehydratase [Lactobacillales bacterium]
MTDIFARTALLLGKETLQKFKKATVMVVGCGAVGGYAVEAVARCGIGHLILVDFDTVSPSNINRQLLALHSTVGCKKVTVAANRVRDIAPKIKVTALDRIVNAQTADDILSHKVDFVIDAIDSLNPKTGLIEKLLEKGIPFISSMGAALKTDPTKIKITNLDKTVECPLAFFIRKRLRRRGLSLKFPVVYSSECVADQSAIEMPEETTQTSGRVRHNMGSMATVTGIFGLMCAHYALMYIKDK